MLRLAQAPWRPADFRGPSLGQPPSSFDQFLGGPGVSLATDIAVVGVGGMLAYSLYKANSEFATAWIIVTTVAVVKIFHDVNRM